jgi:hypothetical protein
MRALAFILAVTVASSLASAQKLQVIKVAGAPVAIQANPADAAAAPEKIIKLDPKVPWIPAADWDSNKAPTVYGCDPLTSKPKFTVVDPSAKALWFYRLLVPVDVANYPILTIKYRATNFDKQAQMILRMVVGKGDASSVAPGVFTGEDVQPDSREHELKKDLTELKIDQPLKNLGIWVSSNDQGNATFEVSEISFAAAEDAKPEKLKDESALKIYVTDDQDKPLAGAKVTADAERLNFSRNGMTDAKGEISVTPLSNDAEQHGLRVEKDGFVMMERVAKAEDRHVFKMVPASYYGGTAKGDDGKPIAKAMVTLSAEKAFTDSFGRELRNCIVTDSSGRWTAPPYPADTSVFKVTLSRNDESGSESVTELDASTLKRSPPLRIMSAPVAKTTASPTTAPSHASAQHDSTTTDKPTGKTSPPAPKVALPSVVAQKVDDTSVTADLAGLKDGMLSLVAKGKTGKDETQKLALEDVVDLTIKTPGVATAAMKPAGKPTTSPVNLKNCRLEMTSGDKLMGELTDWADKKVTYQFDPGIAPIQVPIEQVNTIWCGSQDMITKAKALNEASSNEDVAFAVKDNDVVAVRGVALGFGEGGLKFRFNEEERKLPVARLVGVVLAHPDLNAAAPTFEQQLSFANAEQSLSGLVKSIDAGQLELLTKWDQTIQIPLAKVTKITCKNGKLAYLSDMKPASVEQTPFFDRVYAYKNDKSLDGKPIQLQDGSYARGIAVHSRCRLTYDVGGRYDEFRSKVGFQQPEGKIGDCIVRVTGNGKTLFENLNAKGDDKVFEIKVPLTGIQKLTLEVDYGKNQDVGDRVVWANARVLRSAK